MADAPPRWRHRWGIRQRVVFGYVALLVVALAVSLIVTRQALVSRMERDIDEALAQEVAEMRQLADGIDPATGERFGADVAAIFTTFLRRNVPADREAFYTYVNREFFLASFDAPLEVTRDASLQAMWTGTAVPMWGSAHTSVGEARFLVTPLLDGEVPLGLFVVVHFPSDDRADVLQIIRIAATAGAIVLVIAGATAWSMAGRVLRPIRELTTTAHGISDTDLSGRIPVTGTDELSELGATFNAMIERLERSFSSQRQFLDDVAHELRTPITIVQGHLELMNDDPADRAETLAIVHDELDRMNRYVNDLLLLAKAESTEFLRPEPVDLGELAGGLLPKLPSLGDRRWTIDRAPEPGTVAIVCDPGRVTQALLNLASNAVQHTTAGDEIAFGIEPIGSTIDPSGARFWVRDTGAGIDPALVERLFDRDFRGAASRSARADGLGLGLAIVAAIVRAHGGTIVATNDPAGGARFTIELPTEPPSTPAQEEVTT